MMVKDVTFWRVRDSRVKQYGHGTLTQAPEETGALNQRLNRSATLPSGSYVTLRIARANYAFLRQKK